jgi:uncharacterized protein YbbK (DUF523 family)/uncharacterized protein YbgA (DUF1722 family)
VDHASRTNRIFIGTSACLLGQRVRYDGNHKRMPILADVLAGELEIIPVCPEADIGLGTPREPISLHLVDDGSVALRTAESGRDLTGAMAEYAKLRLSELEGDHLRGFVLKSDSPSCGLSGIPLYREGAPPAEGVGMFASELLKRLPNLPAVEESDLVTFPGLYQFLVCVHTYHRWRELVRGGMTADDMEKFHLGHKVLIEASKPGSWAELGSLSEAPGAKLSDEVIEEYERRLMLLLRKIPSRDSNTEALFQIAFSLEKHEPGEVMEKVITAVDDYRSDRMGLVETKEVVWNLWHKRVGGGPEAGAYLTPIPASLAIAISRPATP